MTWESFYLVCFLVGLFLSAFTLLGGMGHFGGTARSYAACCRMCTLPHGAHRAAWRGGAEPAQGTATVPWWNAFSIMIFLCWFGAAGYLLTRYGSFVAGSGGGAGGDLRRGWRSDHLSLPDPGADAARA